MKRTLSVWAGMFVAFILASSVGAQERPNGLYLTSPLSISAGYDDNLVVNSQAVDDIVSILTAPNLSWFRSTHRSKFLVDYEAQFEFFSRNPDLNAWNHAATLRNSYRINSRLSFDTGNAFLSTSDASLRLADSRFLLPRSRFVQNSFFTGLQYRQSYRTKLFFRFDNSLTTLALSGPRANRFDQMANAGTVTLDHTVNRQHSVTASYAYLHVRPLDRESPEIYTNQSAHIANAGYMYTVRNGLLFRVTGGAVRGREIAYTAGAAVEKQFGSLWMMAGYQRYLSFFGGFAPGLGPGGGNIPFANGLLPSSVFQGVSLRVRGKLTRRVGVELNGQRGRAELGDDSVKSAFVQSRLDCKLTERLVVFARAEYYGQNLSQFSESPLSRRRYFGGLEIVLSRPLVPEDAPIHRRKAPVESAEPQAGGPLAQEEK